MSSETGRADDFQHTDTGIPELLQNRRERLIEHATAAGIDMLMICDPVNIFYFTGVKVVPYERFIAFLLDVRSLQGKLVLPTLERNTCGDSGIDTQFYGDHDDPFAAVVEFFGTSRLPGVEKNSLPLAMAENISSGLTRKYGQKPARFADITGIISDIRLLKDGTELKLIHMAARYSDEILAEISAEIKIRRTEKDIAVDIMSAMARRPNLSIDDFVIQVLSGPGSANPHGSPGDRILAEGDPVTVDFGVCCQHYWSDCTRTFFTDLPKGPFEEIYQTVLAAQQKAIARIRPGVSIAEIDLAAREVIDSAGYGEYFIHRVGHGIGLSIHERPSLHSRNSASLAEGMAITIEPGIYLPGLGGVRIEDDVAVTARGAEVLTLYSKSLMDMVL